MKVRLFRDAEGRIALVKALRFVVVAVLVAAFAWSALKELKSIHWREVRVAFAAIDHTRIGIALGLLVLNYLSLTLYDWMSFRVFGYKFSWSAVAPRAAAAFAFSNFVGLGFVSGAAVRLRLYRDLIPSPAVVARIIALNGISLWTGLLAICGTSLLLCPVPMDAPGHIGDLRHFGWLLIAVPVAWILFAAAHRWLPAFLRQILPPLGAPQVALLVCVSALDWLTLAAIYLALLGPIPKHTALVGATGFWLSYLFAMASLIPSGLGIFEAAVTHFLAPVTAPETVVAAALAYRILYYLFPWLTAVLMMGAVATAPRVGRLMPAAAERLKKLEPTLQEILTETLAILALIAGVVLWFSAAIPPLRDRMEIAAHNMPMAELLIAASHFTSVAAGALLILLSAGLQHRHRESWVLTMFALVVGAIFTFLKGLDFEEAAFLLAVAAVFWWARERYDRKGRALHPRLAATAWGVVLLCAVLYLGIGLWVHRDVSYDPGLWTSVALGLKSPAGAADASRFLRSLLPVGGTIAWLLIRARWAGERPPCPDPAPEQIADAREIVSKHANTTLPQLVLLGDKSLWFSAAKDGFIAWQRRGNTVLALGDPVGPPQVRRDLIRDFRRFADEWDVTPAFYEVSGDFLADYHALGFSFFQLGEEGFVDLKEFSIKGDKGKTFRAVLNQSARAGLTFEVVPALGSREDDDAKKLLAELKEISDAWLAEKSVAEKRFSLGFFQEKYLRECPIALVRKGPPPPAEGNEPPATPEGPTKIVGFANVLSTPDKRELSVDLMRYRPTEMDDMDFLFVNLMKWGQEQGYGSFNLGMSPLAGVGEEAFAKPLERAARFIFLLGEHFYNFRGLRRFKEKFHPRWEPRYLAVPAEWQVPRVLIDVAAITSGGYRRIVQR